jgi:hypothetical protein
MHDAGGFIALAALMIPIIGILTIGSREQCAGDAAGQRQGSTPVIGGGELTECRQQVETWIGVKFFGYGKICECALIRRPVACAARPNLA